MERQAEQITLGFDYNIFRLVYEFLLVKHTPEGTFHGKIDWGEPLKDMQGLHVQFREDGKLEPSFSIPVEEHGKKPRFFRELIRELEYSKIIEPNVASDLLQGQLDAKSEHLQDMRKLVFKS